MSLLGVSSYDGSRIGTLRRIGCSSGNVVACVLSGSLDRTPKKEICTFGTMTDDLLALGEWLVEMGCMHVAMESAGVYWKPVWNVLEAFDIELILANAHHIKNLPRRKTDMKDAEWIAKLLQCGLVKVIFLFPLGTSVSCATSPEFFETQMRGALKHKSSKLLQSLNGQLRRHHRDMIRYSWEHITSSEPS